MFRKRVYLSILNLQYEFTSFHYLKILAVLYKSNKKKNYLFYFWKLTGLFSKSRIIISFDSIIWTKIFCHPSHCGLAVEQNEITYCPKQKVKQMNFVFVSVLVHFLSFFLKFFFIGWCWQMEEEYSQQVGS